MGRRGWLIAAAAALMGALVLGWLVWSVATRGDAEVAASTQSRRVGSGAGPASPQTSASPTQTTALGEAQEAERSARRNAGGILVREINLRLTPQAWAAIAEGDADARIMTALTELTAGHRIDVSDLPRPAADRRSGIPARAAVVTAVDGVPVGSSASGEVEARRVLDSLPPPYRPDSVAVQDKDGRPGLVITYRSASPAGLLPRTSSPSP
jgi:hypothetical protein